MYVPHFNRLDDPTAMRAMVEGIGAAQLVTTGPDGYPMLTRLPVLWDGAEDGGPGRLVFHLARANQQWRSIPEGSSGGPGDDGIPALAVVSDVEAYISPSWYAAKAEHGRVVPTWNYSAVEFTGRVHRHEDPEWLRTAVTRLTDQHEGRRSHPWAVTDAPADYIDKQLKAIVGVEFVIERVEGKAKLSQNRSDEDRAGAVDGLRRAGTPRDLDVAEQMAALLLPEPSALLPAEPSA